MNLSFCIESLFREVNHFDCFISRLVGSAILIVSLFTIMFNLRYLYWSSSHRHVRSRQYSIIISMIMSSSSVIIVITPSVFLQCFSCSRWCSTYYCRIEGFINYWNGCAHMFMLMMISVIRYQTVLQSNLRRQTSEKYSHLAVLFCWSFALVFALAPLFNWNEYIPEGIGFHCGLNWFDRSLSSRLYFLFAFVFVYFAPFIVLFTINIYVYCVIRRLLHGILVANQAALAANESSPTAPSTSPSSSLTNSDTTTQMEKLGFIVSSNLLPAIPRLICDKTTTPLQVDSLARLNRLRADRRFALATLVLISEYLLSWTPYALLALFYLFEIDLISHHSSLMTICAFTAKLSMILNPFIYIATVNPTQLESILYCKRCSCSYCRERHKDVAF